MFEKPYEERLAIWRDFRQSLELSKTPLEDTVSFYKKAPYVSIVTDPWDKSTWLDPWELLHENQYCEFACVLGMCYSLQLTDRFKGSTFEIHIGIDHLASSTYYLLYVDDLVIGYGDNVYSRSDIPSTVISQRIYQMPGLQ